MRALLMLVTGLFLMCGCVSQVIEPEHSPRLIMSKNGDGLVSLSWKTEVGYAYSIYILNDKGQRVRPVKGVGRIIGTGEIINITDQSDPYKKTPYYGLKTEKL